MMCGVIRCEQLRPRSRSLMCPPTALTMSTAGTARVACALRLVEGMCSHPCEPRALCLSLIEIAASSGMVQCTRSRSALRVDWLEESQQGFGSGLTRNACMLRIDKLAHHDVCH